MVACCLDTLKNLSRQHAQILVVKHISTKLSAQSALSEVNKINIKLNNIKIYCLDEVPISSHFRMQTGETKDIVSQSELCVS